MRVPSIALTVLICSCSVALTAGALEVWSWPRGATVIEEQPAQPLGCDAAPLVGSMLVAAPDMEDPYFAGTRIYLLAHDDRGALGVVVNRARPERPRGFTVWEGGPVARDSAVIVLHDDPTRAAFSPAPGVYVASDPSILENPPRRSRIFIGYAGWGPGQLERELREGAWRIEGASAADAL